MDIDSMDEITITMGSKDHHHDHHQSMIMKGKRTKRPRQPSPASAVFTASSCSSGGDGGGGGGGGGGAKLHTKIRSSDSLCSEILSTSTEEDEDMANCLILLARSGRQNTMSTTTIHINNNIEKQEGGEIIIKSKNIGSKKFKEMTTIGGKDGTTVYECKTCNRSFPSFQALGGHRTSHKKHKPTVEIEEKKGNKIPTSLDDDDDHNQEKKKYEKEQENGMKFLKNISPSSLLSLEIANKKSHGNNNIVTNNNSKVMNMKIHECSICGAGFSSGQALGGHMRRHRNPTSATNTTITNLSSHDDDGGERPRNMLELDLNLPAPQEEDDLHESNNKFQFSLFSSSPSLVDCQY